MNSRLEEVLISCTDAMSVEDIEKKSKVQKRGEFGNIKEDI